MNETGGLSATCAVNRLGRCATRPWDTLTRTHALSEKRSPPASIFQQIVLKVLIHMCHTEMIYQLNDVFQFEVHFVCFIA